MTEKRFNARKNIDNDFEERLKVELEDIVGIVEIDDVTNSVELKKEYYREQSKDKHYTYLDYSRDGHIGSFYLNDKPITNKEVWDLLNEQEETIQTQKDYIIRMGHGTIFEEMKRLKERNQRQYERLKEITDLMCARDWKTLETMVDDWEQAEKQLEREWGTYSDLDD